ncbi:DUF4269 domain-containing protein [Schlesneria paludicola]|uniref:DUF4269 domain-containing protein n=1 Tax=Schlesneria paludicola TaxID=360056 RepID=UPI000299FB2D|nr:DUF4269 domain-containing protein [Schlesneria paludicola]
MRPDYEIVLNELDLLSILQEYRPIVIGTPPLGLEVPSSDIDVACSASDLSQFRQFATQQFGTRPQFQCRTIEARGEPSVVASFDSHGWQIELFCQSTPVESQWGVRHFLIEQRLLKLEPRLRPLILQRKQSGMKTEPAFAQVLSLPGDPYESLLTLETATDPDLAALAAASLHNHRIISTES